MKTTAYMTCAVLAGTFLLASAQDEGKAPRRPQGLPPELMKEFDKDGDGKLSDDERASMREVMKAKMEERRKEMLKKFDTDGDGTLSQEERDKAMEERKAEMIKKYDKDGDGKLSEEERADMPKPLFGAGGPGKPGGHGGPGGKPDKAPHGDKGGRAAEAPAAK